MASRMSNAASDSDARMTIEIPNSQPMVALLGANDEYLRLIENAFPSVSVLHSPLISSSLANRRVTFSLHPWRNILINLMDLKS